MDGIPGHVNPLRAGGYAPPAFIAIPEKTYNNGVNISMVK
jgi:hypothetical protein